MRRGLLFGCAVSLVSGGALLFACVADDPDATGGGNPDASGGDSTTDTSTADAGGDVSTTFSDGAVIGVQQVAAGLDHACALLTDGTVWCWGDNGLGQVGLPITNKGQAAPAKVNGISDVIQVSAGTASTCALERDGSVWCWGRNNQLELGGSYASDILTCSGGACNPVPQKVVGVTALQISVGNNQACAIAPSGQITCWGANSFGQCGAPSTSGIGGIAPVNIPTIKGKRLQLGYASQTTCAIDTSFQVWCWGANDKGQLGHAPGSSGDVPGPNGTPYDWQPHNITLNGDAGGLFGGSVDIVSGQTVCVARGAGAVFCWGRDDNDSLALPQADDLAHFVPMQISAVSGATNVSGGEAFCALLDGGALSCWGGDQVAEGNGQFIDGGGCLTFSDAAAPCYGAGILPGPALSQISIFGEVALGVGLDGGAYGWGHNTTFGRIGHPFGAAGDNSSNNNDKPTPIVGLP